MNNFNLKFSILIDCLLPLKYSANFEFFTTINNKLFKI